MLNFTYFKKQSDSKAYLQLLQVFAILLIFLDFINK